MSVCIYLACKPCRKCVWIGQDGLSGFTFYRGHPECLIGVGTFMREHITCDGNMEVMTEHAAEDFENVEWLKAEPK